LQSVEIGPGTSARRSEPPPQRSGSRQMSSNRRLPVTESPWFIFGPRGTAARL